MGLFSRIAMLFKTKASAALDRAEDPRELVDYAYNQQHELLRKTKQGLVEVATSKVRLERQARKLRERVPQIEEQAGKALGMGREDLARIALERKQTILAELEQLDVQAAEVGEEDRNLTHTEQQLAARIEEFRTRRDAISARYTAAQAQVRVTEALSGVSGEFAELGMALGRAVEKTERMEARATAIGGLFQTGTLELPSHGGDPVERDLRQAETSAAVDDELNAIRARLGQGNQPPALEDGSKGQDGEVK